MFGFKTNRQRLEELKCLLLQQLARFNELEGKFMSQTDDLVAAVNRLKDSTTKELKAISDRLSQSSSDPVVAQAITDLNAVSDSLDTETGTLTGNAGSAAPV
jgi:hypothetical protein